ncbi:T9SS type A sorting domain-containing protein [Flavobacterium difficile]|uniref:T9SS type A sorting domain-containing protein n=1 Tax=Flavobacterium difficile TaxID=2709659 RepID=A0ABX0I3G4_9FLAO|nr:T9SS type A sorting domain-containing protein [Flavobacterium difficile]NHM01733.1 T9SS type A sorting domain-containing protein [Flavobacterium difficile]
MKQKITLLTLLILFAIKGHTQTQFWADTFDTAPTSGTRTPEENGGTPTSYFRLTDGSNINQVVPFSGRQGTSFWAGEDHNGTGTGFTASGAEGALPASNPANELHINWTGINIAGKSNLSFRGLIAAASTNEPWDNQTACISGVATTNTDYIIVEYSIDGGPFVNIIRFYNRGSATNGVDKYLFEDTDNNGCGDGIQLTNTFGEFTKNIVGTGNTMNLRIRVFSEGNNEEWGIDNFRLFEVAACTPPTITANPPNRTICNGTNTTFTSSASGATTYQWQVNTGSGFTDITNGGVYSGATSNTLTITGATAGMSGYLYRAVAINGVASCFTNSNSATLTISNITSTEIVTNVSCNGSNNGSIAITPSGGIGPYTYSWSPSGATSATITGLSVGLYTVTITDNVGCQITRNFTITQPTSLSLNPNSQTNVSCNGGTNGAASVNPASGGAGGYTYNWTPGNPNGDGTTIVTGLSAGTWTCTVTDANGCFTTRNFTITQPASAVSGTTAVTNIACNGGTNGAINLTPTGGTPPYTFNWGGGITTEDRTGLSAGSYSVTITDANGCTGTINVTVTQPASAVSGTRTVTNVFCFGGTNGAINLTPTGGTPPYTFNWGGGITTEDRTGLSAGTYSVTITDANGCTGTVNVTVTQPASAVSGTTVVTNVACFGGSNGAINLTPTGGTPPYTFSWGGGITTEDRTGLSAGTYSVTITDANGCTGTVSGITVTQPASAVSGTTAVTNIACNGGTNGAINLTPTGGTPPYTFSWVGGITTEDRTGLSAGSYSVTITDANACTGTVNVTVTQPTAISLASGALTNVSCNGGSNGSASVSPTGGAGGYTYSWSPSGGTAATATGLSAGTYTVTVTDANGCTATRNFTITQPTTISLASGALTNVSCNGGSNGSASVSPTGGAGGYTYSWSPSGGTAATATGLSAGTYTVTVTDANGCTATRNFTITQPTTISLASGALTNVSCNGGSNGSASVSPTGGAGGYTYSWSPSGGTAATATGLSAGTYTVTVTDANACTATRNFTITQPTAIDATVSQNAGILTANQTGATYQWYQCPNTVIAGATNQTFTPTVVGDYKVEVTIGGCSITSTCVTVTTLGNTSFDASNFMYYPNPTSNILYIKNGNLIDDVEVYNLLGQQILFTKSTSKEIELNLAMLPSGSYMIKVTAEGKSKTIKILKQ